jgi:hypothetical protein
VLKKLISAFALALACVCLLQTPEAEAGGGGLGKSTSKRATVYLKNTCYSELKVGVNTTPGRTPKYSLPGPLGTLIFHIAKDSSFYVSAVPSGSPAGTPLCVDQSFPEAPDGYPTYILIDCSSGARVVSQKEWNAAGPCT